MEYQHPRYAFHQLGTLPTDFQFNGIFEKSKLGIFSHVPKTDYKYIFSFRQVTFYPLLCHSCANLYFQFHFPLKSSLIADAIENC